MAREIFVRHFGRKAVAALARKGILPRGTQALPDAAGCYLNSATGYVVDDNGCGRVWSYLQVAEAAQ